MDLINRYQPELIYMDDTAVPLWPVSDAGLKIAAHFYNNNSARNHGDLRAVLLGKILSEEQRKAIVWDIEGRVPATGYPFAWQTCACIGSWHYDRSLYDKDLYKSAKSVIQMLADIVSKNGNLLLSIPLRGDGSIDDKEEKILAGIASWMTSTRRPSSAPGRGRSLARGGGHCRAARQGWRGQTLHRGRCALHHQGQNALRHAAR